MNGTRAPGHGMAIRHAACAAHRCPVGRCPRNRLAADPGSTARRNEHTGSLRPARRLPDRPRRTSRHHRQEQLMTTIPWKSTNSPQPATLTQVSRPELAHARDVPGFLIAALRMRRATLNAPGAVGLSLRAAPLSPTFWTLSSWTDRVAITAFVTSDAHTAVMTQYRDKMAGSHFHTWTETETDQRGPTRFSDTTRLSTRSPESPSGSPVLEEASVTRSRVVEDEGEGRYTCLDSTIGPGDIPVCVGAVDASAGAPSWAVFGRAERARGLVAAVIVQVALGLAAI